MLMRWLLRLAFPALGLLVMLIFFGINDPEISTASTGSPSPATDDTSEVPAFEGLVSTPVDEQGPDIIFKWQDRDGSWHYADQPPENRPWNALAIEPSNRPSLSSVRQESDDDDWESPYTAPFSLDTRGARNGS